MTVERWRFESCKKQSDEEIIKTVWQNESENLSDSGEDSEIAVVALKHPNEVWIMYVINTLITFQQAKN